MVHWALKDKHLVVLVVTPWVDPGFCGEQALRLKQWEEPYEVAVVFPGLF